MEAQVVIIGGGITGAGILRDLAMRGISAVLVEKGDLCNGTSARFHGLLHSGARYAVNDPASARECMEENMILQKIAGHCIEDLGGLFIQLEDDEPQFVENWLTACRQIAIQVEEIDREELLKEEPNLNPKVQRAFLVPDGAVDGFLLVQENVLSAKEYGAKVLIYTEAIGLTVLNGQVKGVKIRTRSGREEIIGCQVVINAAGPWAGKIAALTGIKLDIIANKGTLLVFNQRLTKHIINRCHLPGDGDILVPHHSVSIFGTTSRNVNGPESDRATFREVQKLLSIGQEMLPSLGIARVLRAFAGIRPLYEPGSTEHDQQGRGITRNFFVIDHESRDGIAGMISILGGKFTAYRLMAEKTADLAAAKLGNSVPCRTASELLPGVTQENKKHGHGILAAGQMVCECEQVTEKQLENELTGNREINLNDLRRRTRLGMGTCQGTFCSYRAMGMLDKNFALAPEEIRNLLTDLVEERWKGMQPVLWGQTIQEAEMMRSVYSNILNVEGLEND